MLNRTLTGKKVTVYSTLVFGDKFLALKPCYVLEKVRLGSRSNGTVLMQLQFIYIFVMPAGLKVTVFS